MSSKNFCHHVKPNGGLCGAEPLKGEDFCYFHRAARERARRQASAARRKQPLRLPLLENRDAIQLAIGDVLNALLSGAIDEKKARVLLAGLRLAYQNCSRPLFSRPNSNFLAFESEHLNDGSEDDSPDDDSPEGDDDANNQSPDSTGLPAPKIPPAAAEPVAEPAPATPAHTTASSSPALASGRG